MFGKKERKRKVLDPSVYIYVQELLMGTPYFYPYRQVLLFQPLDQGIMALINFIVAKKKKLLFIYQLKLIKYEGDGQIGDILMWQ